MLQGALCVLFFTVIPLSFLGAQTLMSKVHAVFTGWDSETLGRGPDNPESRAREVLLNFESGIMESLFDSGYICFNEDLDLGTVEMGDIERMNLIQTARLGGASHMVLFEGRIPGTSGTRMTIEGRLQLFNSRGLILASLDVGAFDLAAAFSAGKSHTEDLLSAL